MPRQDIHRPSAIVPEDYAFVAFESSTEFGAWQWLVAERERIRAHMACSGGTYSQHAHGGNCHICGAYALNTALFYHKKSNTYVRTGLDCAETLESCDVARFRREHRFWQERRAGRIKAENTLAQSNMTKAWTIYNSTEGDRYEETTIRDIVGKLVTYGSISDKQMGFLSSLLVRIENRAALDLARAAETAAAHPVPVTEERIRIEARVLSVKEPEPFSGFGPRMLVQHQSGYKLFGSVPSVISGVRPGDSVVFFATIRVSDKDPKFGFFSRPTKAQKVA